MRHIFTPLISASLCLAFLVSACEKKTNDGKMHYPETFRGTVSSNYFGTTVADPYRWLEQENDPEVKNWVLAQNEATQGYLGNIGFRDSIFNRMKEIWNYPKYSVPTKHGAHFFYYKNDGLQNQSILYKQTGLNGKAEVFLDPNKLSKDGTTAISGIYFSNDNKYMTYSVSKAGSDWNEFYTKDVETGEQLKDELKWIKFSGAAWFKNGFFYTRYPEPKGDDALSGQNTDSKIYYHELGKPQAEDKLIFEYPKNKLVGLGASTTHDEKHLLIYLSEGATDNSALYYKDLTKDNAPVVPIVDNFDNLYSVIDD
ncbi:MAG: S9 family peptidase, partial [Bacteroidia bacterium]